MANKRPLQGRARAVAEATAKLKSSLGFILIVDMPLEDRDEAAAYLQRGEPIPTTRRIYSSTEFQPAAKTMKAMAEMLAGMWKIHGPEGDQPPQAPIDIKGDITVGANGSVGLSPRILPAVQFASDGEYGEQLSMLAVQTEVPAGKSLGDEGCVDNMRCQFTYPISTDLAKSHPAALETWATGKGPEMARVTGWPPVQVAELIAYAVMQIKKAWEQENQGDAA